MKCSFEHWGNVQTDRNGGFPNRMVERCFCLFFHQFSSIYTFPVPRIVEYFHVHSGLTASNRNASGLTDHSLCCNNYPNNDEEEDYLRSTQYTYFALLRWWRWPVGGIGQSWTEVKVGLLQSVGHALQAAYQHAAQLHFRLHAG